MATNPRPVGHPQGPTPSSSCRQVEQSTEEHPLQQCAVGSHGQHRLCLSWETQQAPAASPTPEFPGSSGMWRLVTIVSHRRWNAGESAMRLMTPSGLTRKGKKGHSLPGWSWRDNVGGSGEVILGGPRLEMERGCDLSGAPEPGFQEE